MSLIRVALVGLSSSAKVIWAADAHLPYLLSTFGKRHYQIVALLNSSVDAAVSAKRFFKLPDGVKAYGDPQALAEDPDIDLIVVNTRADVHFSVAEPSIRSGKAVYIEWPLTESLETSVRLTKQLSAPSNTLIGLQGRVAPITLRLKELLSSGIIGQVLSSEVHAYGNLLHRDSLPESLTYFADRKVGGHPINIHYGHMIDYVHEVLGDWEEFDAKMQIQRPELKVLGKEGAIIGTIRSDVPDFLSVHGTLASNNGVSVTGATLVATFRLGPPFKGDPGLIWTIAGQVGELRVKAPGPYLMSGDSYEGPIIIEHHDHVTDQVKELGWDWPAWQKELPLRARSVAEMYERYAEWVEGGRGSVQRGREWARLEDGVKLMREFEGLYKYYDQSW
ncbi:oxidoreductase family protein [Pyrenochaeta sp. MPI-SDFR-AT-0127]|nr:oxidoreductase family protein [Pyrenochaeta sp. MPI-SDFR-AT-0127]